MYLFRSMKSHINVCTSLATTIVLASFCRNLPNYQNLLIPFKCILVYCVGTYYCTTFSPSQRIKFCWYQYNKCVQMMSFSLLFSGLLFIHIINNQQQEYCCRVRLCLVLLTLLFSFDFCSHLP